MRGMRNRIVHDHTNVYDEIVWETITTELPPLVALLEHLAPDPSIELAPDPSIEEVDDGQTPSVE